ncbi:hypothetical protein OSB04_un001800 [Centaurea solstitialis]|uniref:Uncharacterized protein n=1 Tax=Centaurea solstitialis TaxID=347529 RepID=A0AA38SL79_9ASTR|nr:hypothetical protein OSB04_un001800 [Centaurea solstitialis]
MTCFINTGKSIKPNRLSSTPYLLPIRIHLFSPFAKSETPTGNEEAGPVNRPKRERVFESSELNKKLTNARTVEDLKSCQLLKSQLFNRQQSENTETPDQLDAKSEEKSESSPSKWFKQLQSIKKLLLT